MDLSPSIDHVIVSLRRRRRIRHSVKEEGNAIDIRNDHAKVSVGRRRSDRGDGEMEVRGDPRPPSGGGGEGCPRRGSSRLDWGFHVRIHPEPYWWFFDEGEMLCRGLEESRVEKGRCSESLYG